MAVKKSALLSGLLQLLTIGLCIAICVIVAQELWWTWSGYITTYAEFAGYAPGTYYFDKHLCLLSPLKSTNVCGYSWAVAAIGIIFACIVIFCQVALQSARALMCQLLFVAATWVWWLAAAIVVNVYANDANGTISVLGQELSWPQKGYRTSIYAMAWSAFGLTCVQFLVCMAQLSGAKKDAQKTDHRPAGAKMDAHSMDDAVKV